jgi:TRAP-type uncharacterized transport system substrate-binding protein
MECDRSELHILKVNDEEINVLKKAISFFYECTIKSKKFNNNDEDAIKTAITLKRMCRIM